MLIATATTVYALDIELAPDEQPAAIHRARDVRQVAEGDAAHVIALGGGRVVVMRADGDLALDTGIEEPITSLALLAEEPLNLLIGTEAPHLYRLTEPDRVAKRIPSFDRLTVRDTWHTPWGGPAALRSLAASGDGWVYADIHVGSIVRSADGGESWAPVTPTLHEDVHQVATCASAPERVYANTRRGVYVSLDRGQTWFDRGAELGHRYGRAIAVHPAQPDCLLASVSDGPRGADLHAALYRSEDAGVRWVHVTEGFPPSSAGNIDTYHVTFTPDGVAWAAVECVLYRSVDHGRRWQEYWSAPGAEPIRMLSAVQGGTTQVPYPESTGPRIL
jgi:hypothetical protein